MHVEGHALITKAMRSRLVQMSPSCTRGSTPVPLNGGTTTELIRFLLLRVLALGVWQEDDGAFKCSLRNDLSWPPGEESSSSHAESAALSAREFLVAWTSSSGLLAGHNVHTSETDYLEK